MEVPWTFRTIRLSNMLKYYDGHLAHLFHTMEVYLHSISIRSVIIKKSWCKSQIRHANTHIECILCPIQCQYLRYYLVNGWKHIFTVLLRSDDHHWPHNIPFRICLSTVPLPWTIYVDVLTPKWTRIMAIIN